MQDHYSSPAFEQNYTYSGSDLGVTFLPDEIQFRLWAPTAAAVALRIYRTGDPADRNILLEAPLEPGQNGTWFLRLRENYRMYYYTYLVTVDGEARECCDPYATATGINGLRGMILPLSETDPAGWDRDDCPHRATPITDHIIYEVHIRDLTVHPESGVIHKGKFLGLCEKGTALPSGAPTGLDHILALGVTHVQLQPIYDFGSVDEEHSENEYNWGYDPVNYNVPDGSYATDPHRGELRVQELKTLIRTLHSQGLGVYMDVVYNHVYSSEDFCFNRIVPGYFSRPGSNGSGCGNDTASERSMVRKYIVDSLYHWVREYHIDGFRFDLAGLIDAQTIRLAMETIHKTHPYVRFYGEGWHMDSLVTKPDIPMANQGCSTLLTEFGFFNDTFRDALRGSVFDTKEKGFLTGKTGSKHLLRSCFMGVTPWACSPGQSINYISCHDNHTLFDRLSLGHPRAGREEIARRSRLGSAFTLLSQGVPFLLAGEELLRSKPLVAGGFDENSYRSPDSVNAIRWNDLEDPLCAETLAYMKGLIRFRKAHPCLRNTDRDQIYSCIKPIPCSNPHLLLFHLTDSRERMIVLFNGGVRQTSYTLPEGTWIHYISDTAAGTTPITAAAGEITVPPCCAMVFVQEKSTQIKDVVAAFITRGNRFLLCQRPAHKARGLLWEFPGGKVEPGEDHIQALIRECREELGMELQIGSAAASTEYSYPDIRIRLTLYRCSAEAEEPSRKEHADLRWITAEELANFPLSPADRALCDALGL